mgnify:CR=1 FL=1
MTPPVFPDLAASIEVLSGHVQQAAFDRKAALMEDMDLSLPCAAAGQLHEGAWASGCGMLPDDLLAIAPEVDHLVTRETIMRAVSMSAAKRLCAPPVPVFCSVPDLAAAPVTAHADDGTYSNLVNLSQMCGIGLSHGFSVNGFRREATDISAPWERRFSLNQYKEVLT